MLEDTLDKITIDLIFALRDSLTDVSRIDFWAGRAATAIETAAAGASTWPEAVTIACRKLQIGTLTNISASTVTSAEPPDYEQWASHVSRNIIYIVALANVARATRNTKPKTATPERIPF